MRSGGERRWSGEGEQDNKVEREENKIKIRALV